MKFSDNGSLVTTALFCRPLPWPLQANSASTAGAMVPEGWRVWSYIFRFCSFLNHAPTAYDGQVEVLLPDEPVLRPLKYFPDIEKGLIWAFIVAEKIDQWLSLCGISSFAWVPEIIFARSLQMQEGLLMPVRGQSTARRCFHHKSPVRRLFDGSWSADVIEKRGALVKHCQPQLFLTDIRTDGNHLQI